MFEKIINFLKIDNVDINKIDFSKNKNSKSNFKSKIFRDILYKEYFFKKIFRMIVPTYVNSRTKLFLDKLNKKTDHSFPKLEEIDIPNEYYKWNNIEVDNIEAFTNLNTEGWYY